MKVGDYVEIIADADDLQSVGCDRTDLDTGRITHIFGTGWIEVLVPCSTELQEIGEFIPSWDPEAFTEKYDLPKSFLRELQ